ncbi:MAG: hypothetical protein K0S07_820 [Chlamydiales bacterium]|jgi:hypothetical protein|nr:hypothetical protein [Chlamydiales bacterium]
MRLFVAIQAFFKALKNPDSFKSWLADEPLRDPLGDYSHLSLLKALQTTGRLIDFLKEDISSFEDNEVGAAVREIHQECSKSLEDLVTIRPILDQGEGKEITIEEGYSADTIKLTGRVQNTFPLKGVVVHRGWKALKRSLPKALKEENQVIQSAEVEVR